MNSLCRGSAQPTTSSSSSSTAGCASWALSRRRPHTQVLKGVGMANNRNYFKALAGLKLEEDTPTSSPTAAAAAEVASANGSDGTSQDAESSRRSSSEKARDSKKIRDALVWIDLEMTGLEPDKHTIIEIACLITNGDLTKVLEGPEIAIHHPESVLDGMNDWCKEHHNKSGLVQRVRDSKISMREAEQQVLSFVQQHTEYQQAQLAGNSVHVDRVYLQRYMPELNDHLHYRIVDVSTIKELCRRWRPKLSRQAPRKVANHTAMSDIKESLKELQYYKHVLFRGK